MSDYEVTGGALVSGSFQGFDQSYLLQALDQLGSIDHLGLTKDGTDKLFKLVDQGVKVKATGFGRLDFNPIALMKKIYSINSEALLFGTDLPSTRAKEPFSGGDVDLI